MRLLLPGFLASCFSLFPALSWGQKISDLPATSTVASNTVLPVVLSGSTTANKITVGNFFTSPTLAGTAAANVVRATGPIIAGETSGAAYAAYGTAVYGAQQTHGEGFGVNRQLNGRLNNHAFEDWSILNQTGFTDGYASFDAQPIAIGGSNDHLVGFQSRPIWASSGNVTSYMAGLTVYSPANTSTGTIANYYGLRLNNITNTGGGAVTNNYGIYIASVTGGVTTNRSIYSAGGVAEFNADVATNASGGFFSQMTGSVYGGTNRKGFGLYADATYGANLITSGTGTFSTTVPDINFLSFNGSTITRLAIIKGSGTTAGNVGIGTTTPTAKLTINGSLQVSTAGTNIASVISSTAAVDFGSMAAGAEDVQTLTVTGAATTSNPSVALGWSASLESGIVVKQTWVSGANTISIRALNTTGGTVDPASVNVRATVTSF